MKIRFFFSSVCCLFAAMTSQALIAADKAWIEHVNKADPPISTTLLRSDLESIAFKFPTDTNSWQVNFSVERDLPEIGFSLSGEAKSLEDLKTMNTADAAAVLLNNCSNAGLPTDCTNDATSMSEFKLEPGDSLIANINFHIIDNTGKAPKTESFEKIYRYKMETIGTLRFGVGTFFIFSGADDYFTTASDGTNVISSKSGDDLTLNLAATATWIPHKYSSGNGLRGGWNFGPTIGVGTNSDNLSIFAGVSAIYRRAWTFTAGIAAAKESTLVSQYEVGQVVPEPIDSSALTKESYKARFFVGLSWSPPAKK